MKNIWEEIKKETKRISPEIYKSINKPATNNEIYLLEKELKVELPDSFKDYLLVCNGQNHKQRVQLIGYNQFMPILEIISDWKKMNKLFLGEPPIEFILENKIKPLYWSDKWIPFANFEGSNRLIMDLNAGKNGVNGQIIQLYPGCDLESDDCVISDSFEQFSNKILATLQNNDFKIEDGVIDFEWL